MNPALRTTFDWLQVQGLPTLPVGPAQCPTRYRVRAISQPVTLHYKCERYFDFQDDNKRIDDVLISCIGPSS